MAGILTQLETISEQLREVRNTQEEQGKRFDKLEELLEETRKENAKLKEEVTTQKDEITQLKEKVNHLEQRNRNDCLRIFDMPINGDAQDNSNVAQQVYHNALLPILRGAVSKNRLSVLPSPDDLIEVTHILPGRKEVKPILCRLKKNFYRTILLQHKKEFALRTEGRDGRPGAIKYPIHEDVTRDTYRLMRKLAEDERVLASWIVGGTIRFRLKDSEEVRKVTAVFGDYDANFV